MTRQARRPTGRSAKRQRQRLGSERLGTWSLGNWSVRAAAVTMVAVGLTAVPATRSLGLCGSAIGASVAVLVGVTRYRPRPSSPWLQVSLMLALWSGNGVITAVTGRRTDAAVGLAVAGQLVASGLVVSLFLRWRGTRPATRRRWSAWASTDRLLMALAGALVLAQVFATAAAQPADSPHNWLLLVPALDVLLAGALLRFLLSRSGLVPSSRLVVAAALVTIVYDMLVSRTGFRITESGSPLGIIFALAACLFGLAALHPSMRTAVTPDSLHRRRPESARLKGLVPLAAVPAVLWLLGGTPAQVRLPVGAYLAVGMAVAVIGLMRGASAVATSERRAAEDPLTGLANRRGLAAAYASAASGPAELLVAILDLDDFKEINDRFGHDTGDTLLVDVAKRLRAAMPPDGFVARSGGDEFVLLHRGSADELRRLVGDVFGEPFDVLGGPRTVRGSVGVTSTGPGVSLASALGDADIALYAVKADGKGGVHVYRPELREQVLGRLALLGELRRMMQHEPDAGSLEVHYQPLVALGTRAATGCEALVRWRHPQRGLVPPDAFLDLAEQHGLAAAIDATVLDTALGQLREWDAAGLRPMTVSVNLGRSSMLAPDLAESVRQALGRHGIEPTRLHLEITEHDQLPPGAGVAALDELASVGVRVGLDDFGVGWTSLDYLRRYPISLLKLDRSLSQTVADRDGSPLLAGIVQLARSLGIPVLAEGIETAEQLGQLHALGVDYGQGFHLARPLPATEVNAHFRAEGPALPDPRPAPDSLGTASLV